MSNLVKIFTAENIDINQLLQILIIRLRNRQQ